MCIYINIESYTKNIRKIITENASMKSKNLDLYYIIYTIVGFVYV